MILNMYKSRRIVEVDEFRAGYDPASGFRIVYAILRNGETITLTREFSSSNVVHYGYNGEPPLPNTDTDDESVSDKDIWDKIKKAVMAKKPVSLPI